MAIALDVPDPFKAPKTNPVALDVPDPFKPIQAQGASKPAPARSWGEVASDTARGIGTGFVNLSTGLAQVPNLLTGGALDKYVVRPAQSALSEALGGPATSQGIAGAADQINEGIAAGYSPTLKQEQSDLQNTEGWLAKAWKVATSPTLLGQFAAEQVPMLATLGVGTSGTAASAGARALAGGATEATALAAGKKAAERALVGANALMGGGFAGNAAISDVLNQPQEKWDADPEYQSLIQSGVSPDEAKQQVALRAGQIAGAVAAPISAAAGAITAPLEASIFTRAMDVPALFSKAGAAKVGQGIVKEASEEFIQEGGEQFGQNLGVQQTIDPARALDQDVLDNAAIGATVGGIIGGGITAGGIAASPASPAKPVKGKDPAPTQDPAPTISPAAQPPVGVGPAPAPAPQVFPNAAPGSLADAVNATAEATSSVAPPQADALVAPSLAGALPTSPSAPVVLGTGERVDPLTGEVTPRVVSDSEKKIREIEASLNNQPPREDLVPKPKGKKKAAPLTAEAAIAQGMTREQFIVAKSDEVTSRGKKNADGAERTQAMMAALADFDALKQGKSEQGALQFNPAPNTEEVGNEEVQQTEQVGQERKGSGAQVTPLTTAKVREFAKRMEPEQARPIEALADAIDSRDAAGVLAVVGDSKRAKKAFAQVTGIELQPDRMQEQVVEWAAEKQGGENVEAQPEGGAPVPGANVEAPPRVEGAEQGAAEEPAVPVADVVPVRPDAPDEASAPSAPRAATPEQGQVESVDAQSGDAAIQTISEGALKAGDADKKGIADVFRSAFAKAHGSDRMPDMAMVDLHAKELERMISEKDADGLRGMNIGDRKAAPAWRAVFEFATGMKLPPGIKASEDAVDRWAGVSADERVARTKALNLSRLERRVEKEVSAARRSAETVEVVGKDGEKTSGAEFVDSLIRQGFDQVVQKGQATWLAKNNDDGSADGWKMPHKALSDYARRKIKALSSGGDRAELKGSTQQQVEAVSSEASKVSERQQPWTVGSSEWMAAEKAAINEARASDDAEITQLRARVDYNRQQLRGKMPKADRARLERIVADDESRILQLSARPLDPDAADITKARHRRIVENAIGRGESIPAEVLAEYPGLAESERVPVQETSAQPVKADSVLDLPTPKLEKRLADLDRKRADLNTKHMQKYRDGSATREQTTTHNARTADLNEQIKEIKDELKKRAKSTAQPDATGDAVDAGSGAAAKPPASGYEAAKAVRDAAEARVKDASETMQKYPRGAIGLTPDDVKASPKWKADKAELDAAMSDLKKANATIAKHFAKESSAERDARREAKASESKPDQETAPSDTPAQQEAQQASEFDAQAAWDAMTPAERGAMLDQWAGAGQTEMGERYKSRAWGSFNVGEKGTLSALLKAAQDSATDDRAPTVKEPLTTEKPLADMTRAEMVQKGRDDFNTGVERQAAAKAAGYRFQEWLQGWNEAKADAEAKSDGKVAVPSDFPLQEVTGSYSGISHSGSGQAKMDRDAFVERVQSVYDKAKPLANSEAQQAALDKAIQTYKDDYIAQTLSLARVRSGAYSGFVAGRANINTRQADRRNSALDKAIDRFTAWDKEAAPKVKAAVLAARTAAEVAAEQAEMDAAQAAKQEKRQKSEMDLMRKILADKGGEPLEIGGMIVTKVNNDKDGYPLTLTIKAKDGSPLVNDKLNLATEVFGQRGAEGAKVGRQKIRELVDSIRTEKPAESKPDQETAPTVAPEQQEAKQASDDRVPEQKPDSKTPNVDAQEAAISALNDGTLTVDQYRAAFESALSSEQAIKEELSGKTKDALLGMLSPMLQSRYRGDKKAAVVNVVYREMVSDYALRGFSYGMSSGSWESAIRNLVESETAETLAAYAEKLKSARAARAEETAAREESIADPKTLEDFRLFIRNARLQDRTYQEAYLMLTPEQRARYDALEAESTREAREERQRKAKTAVRAAGQATDGQIIEAMHTRDNYPLFVVQLSDRLSADDYRTVLAGAKKLGGWYSKFRGNGAVPGFQFKDRAAAEAFVKLAGGDTSAVESAAEQRRDAFDDDRSQSAVERLREMADRLDESADSVINASRKTNTARRAAFAASALNSAEADKALAKTMRNIASAIDSGTAKFLSMVRTKTQVELLRGIVRAAKDNELRAKYSSYADQEKHKGQPATDETAGFAEFPAYTAFRSDLASLARQMLEVDGLKKLGQQLMTVADDVTDAYIEFAKQPANLYRVSSFAMRRGDDVSAAVFNSKEAAEKAIKRSGLVGKAIVLPVKRGDNRVVMSPSEAINQGIWTGDGDKRITLTPAGGEMLVEAIGRRGNKANNLTVPWQFQNTYDRRKALSRIGIETPAEFRSALREFIGLQAQATANKAREMELAMVGRKSDGLDFFPTPAEIADQMIEAAEIQAGMRVLEPSAGMGHIADRIREAGSEPDVIEMAGERRELLQEKGYSLVASDFTEFTSPTERGFTFGDLMRAPDGTVGILRGQGGMGSDRVRLVSDEADSVELGKFNFSELEGVERRGSDSGYDRIVMNPPFSNRRDAEHVRHAYGLLKPGGRIVAIMGEGVFFGQDKKAQDFREWLEDVGGTSEKLPPGSFMDPSLPVNTGVSARMVVIDKDGESSTFSHPPSDTYAVTGESGLGDVVRDAIASWSGDVPAVRLIGKAEQLPDSAKRGAGWQTAEGYYDGNQAWIVLGNIQNPARALKVLRHEAVGHYGADRIVGDDWPVIAKTIAALRGKKNTLSPKMRAMLLETESRYAGKVDDETFAKEFIAVLAENNVRASFMDKVYAVVRKFLRAIGLASEQVSQAEIRDVVSRAFRRVERGGRQAAQTQNMTQSAMSTPDRADAAGRVAQVFLALAESDPDSLMRYAKSDAKDLPTVVSDILGRDVKVTRKGVLRQNFEQKVPGAFAVEVPAEKWAFRTGDGKTFDVYIEGEHANVPMTGRRLFIDAAFGKSGKSMGSGIYAALFQYALNNGMVFTGDPAGLSDAALLRRTEHMLSAAIKHGTTRMMQPHPRQLDPADRNHGTSHTWLRPLQWKIGDDAANVAALLDTSTSNTMNLLRGTDANGYVYSLSDGRLLDARGEVVSKQRLVELASQATAALETRVKAAGGLASEAVVGSTTVARAISAQSLIRQVQGRSSLLADVAERLSRASVESDPLYRAFYSLPPTVEESAQFEATSRAYGGPEGYERAKGAGRTKLTYGQWVTVRTPNFKRWFGDWEALRAQQRMDAMQPIKVDIPPEWRGLSVSELRSRVAEVLDSLVRERASIDHPEVGTVRIERAGQRKTVSEGRDPAKLLIAADLSSVLPGAVLATKTPAKGGQNYRAFVKLVAPVEVGSTRLAAVFTLVERNDGTAYYNAVALEDQKQETPTKAGASTPGPVRDSTADAEGDPLLTGVAGFSRRALTRVNPDTVSKGVDQTTGEPLVVYHGSSRDIEIFAAGADEAGQSNGNRTGAWGSYFTPSAAEASIYAEIAGGDSPQNVVPVYLAIRNPYVMNRAEWGKHSQRTAKAATSAEGRADAKAVRAGIEALGHDGIVIRDRGFNDEWVAFRPEQVKSAIGNNGNFSPDDSRITFSRPPVDTARAVTEDPKGFIDRLSAALKPDNLTWKEAITAKLQDGLPVAFGALTLRHLADVGAKYLPQLRGYIDVLNRMQTDRNAMQEEGNAIAEKWQKAQRKNRHGGELLADIMHDATIAGVDPAKDYEPLTIELSDRTRVPVTEKAIREEIKRLRAQALLVPGEGNVRMVNKVKAMRQTLKQEKARVRAYPLLVRRYNALPEDMKAIYAEARDIYERRADQTMEALEARIQALEASPDKKRVLLAKMRAQFEDNRVAGPYFPLQRFGEFWIAATNPDGKREFFMYESTAEQLSALRELDSMGYSEVKSGRKIESSKDIAGVGGAFMADLGAVLDDVEATDNLKSEIKDQIWQLYLRTLPDLSQRKHFIHRKKVKGYSKDALRAFAANMNHGAYQIARLQHAHKLQNLMLKMKEAIEEQRGAGTEANTASALYSEMSKRHDWVMNPQDSQLVNQISSLGFAWYLGVTPGAALVNMTQTAIVAGPVLAARFGAGKATRALMDGMHESVRTGGNIERRLSGEELAAYQAMRASGAIDKTQAHNLAGIAEIDTAQYNDTWHRVMKGISYLFHKAEVVNREATGMAAFRLARAGGMTFDQAVQYAEDVIWESHFDYCVDTETEALTLDGWKRYDQIRTGDVVLGVDGDGRAVETSVGAVNVFRGPKRVLRFDSSRRFSMVLTPSHDALVQRYDSMEKRWSSIRKVSADQLKGHHFILRAPLSPIEGRDKRCVDDFAALLGWIAAEGQFAKFRGCDHRSDVRLAQSDKHNPEYVQEIRAILERLGGEASEYSTRKGEIIVWTINGDLRRRIVDAMPEKLLHFGMLKWMTADQMARVIDSFAKGDGSRRGSGAWTIVQKAGENSKNLDVLQAMATACGISATVSQKGAFRNLILSTGERKNTQRTMTKSLRVSEATVDTVWCPTTGTGNWIARRGGAVFVTGNSNANRARFMQSGTAKVLLMFRQYSLSMTYFLWRNFYQSFKGASPRIKKEARTKLMGVLGMTGVFAGVLGMPLMSVMFGVANAAAAAFGDDDDEPFDAETAFRNFLADMLGADAANAIARGPVNAMTGADIASRVSLDNLWLREPERELEGKALADYWLEQAAGPIFGGLFVNSMRGLQMIQEGNIERGVEAMTPKAVRDFMRTVRYTADGVQTQRGDVLIEDLSPLQLILQATGLSPAEVNERYDANNAIKRYEDAILGRRESLLDGLAMAIRYGDSLGRDRIMQQIRAFNRGTPELAIDMAAIRRSLQARARYTSRASDGIIVNPRIEQKARQQGRFAEA